jgi:serine/threonine protein phosphatase PrpC
LGSWDRHQSTPEAFVMKSVTDSLLDAPIDVLARMYSRLSDEECEGAITAALQKANWELNEISTGTTGVTITGALVRGNSITFGHVGAARLYWIDRRSIQVLTRDHLAMSFMPPYRPVLYIALGKEVLTTDVSTYKNTGDGYLLLCTWRLWESVTEESLRDIVMTSINLEKACAETLNKGRAPFDDRGLALILASYTQNKPFTGGLTA